jgi:hypothetical protein
MLSIYSGNQKGLLSAGSLFFEDWIFEDRVFHGRIISNEN